MKNMRLRFPGGKEKAFTMSYDDGVQQDVRLIEIMRRNGVKGTCNIGAGLFAEEGTVYPEGQVHRRMTLNECLKAYEGDDIEVAVIRSAAWPESAISTRRLQYRACCKSHRPFRTSPS